MTTTRTMTGNPEERPMNPRSNEAGQGEQQHARISIQEQVPCDADSESYKINTLIHEENVDTRPGDVVWNSARSLWNGGMLLAALVLGPMYFNLGAFLVFAVLLEITMCSGHSVGFHRRLIHRTFACPKWLEHVLVWSGTLVGMQGPFWVI